MACLHHLFEQWVDQDPGAPAIASEDQVLTYGEVERLANELARRILSARNNAERPEKEVDSTVGIYLLLRRHVDVTEMDEVYLEEEEEPEERPRRGARRKSKSAARPARSARSARRGRG